jgi:hypothetical protein
MIVRDGTVDGVDDPKAATWSFHSQNAGEKTLQ